MTLLSLVRGNASLVFNQQPYSVMEMTGGGLFPVRLLKERGAQQDGSTVVGYLLDERLINLSVLIAAPTRAALVGYRDALAAFIKPVDGLILSLRADRDDNSARQVDVKTTGIVDFPNTQDNRTWAVQRLVIQLEASDPVPYDPILHNIIFTVASGSPPGGYASPFKIPLKYAPGGSIHDTESLTYAGQWTAYPRIYITGPAVDPVITNKATGDKLDFTGTSIPSGDVWLVNLAYGVKRIFNQNNIAKDSALTNDSNLITWGIFADPKAPSGINDIGVTVPSGATTATQIRVEFNDRYPSLD